MNTTPRTVYRFEFVHRVDIDEVEQTLALSILAVGCLQGEAAVRLDAGYAIDRDRRVIVVDGDPYDLLDGWEHAGTARADVIHAVAPR